MTNDSKFASLFKWALAGALGLSVSLGGILYAQTDKRVENLEAGQVVAINERNAIKAESVQRIAALEAAVKSISSTTERLEKQLDNSQGKQDNILQAVTDLRIEVAKKLVEKFK